MSWIQFLDARQMRIESFLIQDLDPCTMAIGCRALGDATDHRPWPRFPGSVSGAQGRNGPSLHYAAKASA